MAKRKDNLSKNSEKFINLQFTSPEVIEALPGQTISVSACIANESDSEQSVIVDACPIKGWRVIPQERETISISAHQTNVQLYAVVIPNKILAGEYTFTLKAQIGGKPESGVITTKLIRIKPLNKIDLSIKKSSSYIEAGKSYTLQLNCINKGNTPIRCQIEISSYPDYRIEMKPKTCILKPYQTVPCQITVYTNQENRSVHNALMIKVIPDKQELSALHASVGIEVIPKGISQLVKGKKYLEIPSHLRLASVKENKQTAFLTEIAGSGMFDPDRKQHVEYCLRHLTPHHESGTVNGEFNQYYAGWKQPGIDIKIGDTVYELSSLTEYGRYARGFGINVSPGKADVGAILIKNVFKSPTGRQPTIGSYIGYRMLKNWDIRFNFLEKHRTQSTKSHLLTAQTSIKLNSHSKATFEAGKDTHNKTDIPRKNAYRATLKGRLSKKDIFYSFEKSRAGPSYYGYYNNIDLFTSAIDFPLTYKLRGNFSTNFLKQNLNTKYNDSIATRQKQYEGNLVYSISSNLTLTGNALILKARDVSQLHTYDFNQKWLGAKIGWNKGDFGLYYQFFKGRQNNYLLHTVNRNLNKYLGSIYYNFGSYLNLFTSFESGNMNYFDITSKQKNIGIGFNSQLNSIRFGLQIQRVSTKSQTNKVISHLALTNFNYIFPNQHVVSFTSRHSKIPHSRNTTQNAFEISYTIPFGLPTKKRKDIGGIYGQVFDSDNKQGIENAVVNVGGNRVFTDAQGKFFVPGLKPDTYFCSAELLPENLISYHAQPDAVKVNGGRDQEITINATAKCKIKGKIHKHILQSKTEQTETTNNKNPKEDIYTAAFLAEGEKAFKNEYLKARIFIQRQESFEVLSQLADRNGNFSFSNLRPGTWKVYISTDKLPSNVTIKHKIFTLIVEPGEEEMVNFDVFYKPRKIIPISN